MSSITMELAKMLSGVERHGDYYATGAAEIFAPQVEVEGVGVIALPLLPSQAEHLVKAAERAPYGKGQKTLHDESVRRTWQIDAARVRLKGRRWEQSLSQIVKEAADGLGVSEPVTAELYKLLVYGEGDFFVQHRDTEKVPGMFATLVIVLPSVYTGGELIVRHKGREATLDLQRDDPSDAAYAAFYADCVHEVRPITSGCRLALIYNLRRVGKGARPQPPDYQSEERRVEEALRQWAVELETPGSDAPEKLIYPLEHAYTPAEIAFDALKGADAAVAGVLADAAENSGCALHLALVSITESGIAEYTGSRWGDDDDLEAGEVDDRLAILTDLKRFDGAPALAKEIPFEDSELCPPDAFDDLEGADIEFQEATGNAGASFERTYQRAALVLWPRERELAVLNQAGQGVALAYLSDLVDRWGDGGGDCASPEWRKADELCGHMMRTWKVQTWLAGRDDSDKESDASKMLKVLTRLKAAPRIAAFLSDVTAMGEFSQGDAGAIVGAAKLLRPAQGGELIGKIIALNAPKALNACAALLAAAARHSERPGVHLTAPARVLLETLPGDPAKTAEASPWLRPRFAKPGLVADVLDALDRADPALSARAITHILAWPKTYDPDSTLVPAALTQVRQARGAETEAAARLRRACLEHLRARIALSLEPPADWRRSGVTSCTCADCRNLDAFLAAPDQKTWMLKAAEARRGHIEEVVRRDKCDLDAKTDARGRPYTLICTKNQKSYEVRVKQREEDLANLAVLEGSSK